MKLLAQQYIKKKIIFDLVERSDKAAIYCQNYNGEVLAYEVFKIKQALPHTISGIEFPAMELFPSDESFGVWAWSYGNYGDLSKALVRAQNKYAQLNAIQNDKSND